MFLNGSIDQPINVTFLELERLLEMKQVAAENNLVALNELISTAESVLQTNYKEELSK